MTNHARIVRYCQPLASEFGIGYATRLFGEDVISALPKITKGANKGKPRGFIVWEKAIVGGWSQKYGVCRPGLVRALLTNTYMGTSPIYAQWNGRIQPLEGHRDAFKNPKLFQVQVTES